MTDVCASCGVAVAGGTEGCQRLFEAIGLREYEDMRFARYHRIVVDIYAMQHPDRYGRSAKSFAAHLTGLCAWLEDEAGALFVNAAVQRWLSGPSPIEKPPLPPTYGAITIRDLVAVDDPVRYAGVLPSLGELDLGRLRLASGHCSRVDRHRTGAGDAVASD